MSMREKMARKMMERATVGDLFFDWNMAVREGALDNMLPSFLALVDAALVSLLEPTADMIEAGKLSAFDPAHTFHQMIQAIKDGK